MTILFEHVLSMLHLQPLFPCLSRIIEIITVLLALIGTIQLSCAPYAVEANAGAPLFRVQWGYETQNFTMFYPMCLPVCGSPALCGVPQWKFQLFSMRGKLLLNHSVQFVSEQVLKWQGQWPRCNYSKWGAGCMGRAPTIHDWFLGDCAGSEEQPRNLFRNKYKTW